MTLNSRVESLPDLWLECLVPFCCIKSYLDHSLISPQRLASLIAVPYQKRQDYFSFFTLSQRVLLSATLLFIWYMMGELMNTNYSLGRWREGTVLFLLRFQLAHCGEKEGSLLTEGKLACMVRRSYRGEDEVCSAVTKLTFSTWSTTCWVKQKCSHWVGISLNSKSYSYWFLRCPYSYYQQYS